MTSSVKSKSLAVVWTILSFLDGVLTFICLHSADNVEANPIGNLLLSQGEWIFYGVKIIATTIVGIGFWALATRVNNNYLRWIIIIQAGLALMYFGIIVNNLMYV